MIPDVPKFKVRVFVSNFEFWIGVNEYSSRHFNSNFALHRPILLSIDHSSRCKLKVYIITHTKEKPSTTNRYFSQISKAMKVKRVSKIWVRLSTVILIFIYSNSKYIKSLVKMRTLNAGTSGFIPKRNCLNLLTLCSPICRFIRKRTSIEWLSFTLDETIRSASKWSFKHKMRKIQSWLISSV